MGPPVGLEEASLLTDALAYWSLLHDEVRDCSDPFSAEGCIHDGEALSV